MWQVLHYKSHNAPGFAGEMRAGTFQSPWLGMETQSPCSQPSAWQKSWHRYWASAPQMWQGNSTWPSILPTGPRKLIYMFVHKSGQIWAKFLLFSRVNFSYLGKWWCDMSQKAWHCHTLKYLRIQDKMRKKSHLYNQNQKIEASKIFRAII